LETEWVPILEILKKKGGFEASIITTFNAYLPFYEEIILRHLIYSGCRHNVLMMDTGCLSESLETPTLRPQFAGHRYTLIPISTKGAFHPKIALLVSKKKGLLLVGSNNMTLSGWGINKELTNCITFGAGDKEGVNLVSQAWAFLRTWLDSASELLPSALQDAFQAVKQFAPWLNDNPHSEEGELRFYGSKPEGETIWAAVSKSIEKPIERVTVIGPFFDSRFDFIHTLKHDLNPREIVIGIDPETVFIPEIDHKSEVLKFVDASRINQSSGYLHAKAIFIEGISSKKWLITGSANPSRPAWNAPMQHRNAEAVIMHSGRLAGEIGEKLGVAGLKTLDPLSEENWSEINKRSRLEQAKENPGKPKRCLVGIAKKGLIQVAKSGFSVLEYLGAVCFDEYQKRVCDCSRCETIDDFNSIPVANDFSSVRFLEIRLKGDQRVFCLVHHAEEIARRSMSSRQVQFRRNLAALQDGSSDLENLIVTIEKIIFDEPFEIDPSAKHRQPPGKKSRVTNGTQEITTLMTDLSEAKKQKFRRRMVTSGDIGHLLDILIHHLGEGLEKDPAESTDKLGRSEEELIGTDDEEPEVEIEPIDTPKLVKIANRKVRRLVRRMIQNFEKVDGIKEGYEKCLVKLLGVLALLRELRVLDNKLEDIPFGETFVPVHERELLLKQSVKYLYGRNHNFLAKIELSVHSHPWDEVSRLLGLLLWLAHDCGARLNDVKGFNEPPEEEKKRISNVSLMLLITPDAVSDCEASNEAKLSIEKTTRKHRMVIAKEWIKEHKRMGEKLFQLKRRAHILHKRINGQPRAGYAAFIRNEINPTFSLILNPGDPVTLTDVCSENGKKMYHAAKVAAFKIPQP